MAVKVRPDLIVLDVMMPRISGFDVLDIVRTTPEIAHTKVIMMTALGSSEDKERGEKLGVDQYLVKSQVTLEDVVTTIKKVLEGGSSSAGEPIVGQDSVNTPEAATAVPLADTTSPVMPPEIPQEPLATPPQ